MSSVSRNTETAATTAATAATRVGTATARHATTRRQVLAGGGAAAAIAFTGAFSELFAGTAAARGHGGYGPLVPDPDGLLDLPKGFRYRVLSREGDPLRSGEGQVPGNHDGMAAFAGATAASTWSATTRTGTRPSSVSRPSTG